MSSYGIMIYHSAVVNKYFISNQYFKNNQITVVADNGVTNKKVANSFWMRKIPIVLIIMDIRIEIQ